MPGLPGVEGADRRPARRHGGLARLAGWLPPPRPPVAIDTHHPLGPAARAGPATQRRRMPPAVVGAGKKRKPAQQGQPNKKKQKQKQEGQPAKKPAQKKPPAEVAGSADDAEYVAPASRGGRLVH